MYRCAIACSESSMQLASARKREVIFKALHAYTSATTAPALPSINGDGTASKSHCCCAWSILASSSTGEAAYEEVAAYNGRWVGERCGFEFEADGSQEMAAMVTVGCVNPR